MRIIKIGSTVVLFFLAGILGLSLWPTKKKVTDTIIETRTIGLRLGSCNVVGESHKLFTTVPRKRLLSETLVAYEEVKTSPSRTKIAFIDWTNKGRYKLGYRLMVYDLNKKVLKIGIETECDYDLNTKCQISRFNWVNDDIVHYSYDWLSEPKEWLEVKTNELFI